MPTEPTRRARPLLRLAAACLALAAAGCATWPPGSEAPEPPAQAFLPPPPPPPPVVVYVPTMEPVDQAARQALAYQERVARLSTAELAQEFVRLGDGSASPQAALELALALGYTRNPADMQRALGVLERLQRDPLAQPWHGLARLLASRYAEQHRAEEQAERLAQQLRDTQRDNQRRVEQLNQQLEALKAIERSLNARPAAPPAAAPAVPPVPAAASRPAS